MKYWHRKGLFYYTFLHVYGNGILKGIVTKKLDFVSYHLIKWWHGQKKLDLMAMDSYFKDKLENKEKV